MSVRERMWRPSRREILIGASALVAAPSIAVAAAEQYPLLSPDLKKALAAIEPSVSKGAKYYPCEANLVDNTKLDGVYFIEADAYEKLWSNSGQTRLSMDRVESIAESPTRLPVKLANKIYRAGEAGMGYFIFTLVFEDGTRLPCRTGDAVDFVEMPKTFQGRKVVNALPHVGRQDILHGKPQGHNASFFWCPYRTA